MITTNSIKVVLADDHILIRAGIRKLLEKIEGIEVVGEATDGRQLLELVQTNRPDVVLTDIAMPGLNGLVSLNQIKKLGLKLQTIVLSMHSNEEYVTEAFKAGASGYIVKGADPSELELAIKAVQRGELFLSPGIARSVVQKFIGTSESKNKTTVQLTSRQREILQLIAEGQTTKDIAKILRLSVKTIDSHRSELMNRLDIHDIAGLVRYAIRQRLISLDS